MSGSAMREVVVVGAGPVGLWLAAELRRTGVEVTVLERLTEPVPHAKSLTMHPRTLELLAMRGLADRWLAEGKQLPTTHFALLDNRVSYAELDTKYRFVLFLPQPRTEALLAEHASDLGVEVLRGRAVTGVRSFGDSVLVETETGETFQSRWVVGCDGPSSTVRKAAGIEFLGSPSTLSVPLGDVRLAEPPESVSLTVNGDNGALFLVSLGDGRYRVSPTDHSMLHVPKDEPLTLEELKESTRRVVGTDFGMHDPSYLARFGNATLQAARYRNGRILLAGDAAHIHMPLGGQGLNLGMQDATNLAWKLAAVIQGWAPEDLLDTYETERHPVGARVLADTLAQTSLVVSTSPENKALRARFNELIAEVPALNRELAVQVSGLGVSYGSCGSYGWRMPDLDVGGIGVFSLLREGRFVYLSSGDGAELALGPRVDVVRVDGLPWDGVLVRPDGHVGWVDGVGDAFSGVLGL
ncbi:FAD-dependent monooxygenase [Allokutzneria multivorans]